MMMVGKKESHNNLMNQGAPTGLQVTIYQMTTNVLCFCRSFSLTTNQNGFTGARWARLG